MVVRLQPPGVIRGRVINAATGKPVKQFRVRVTHSPDRQPDDPKGGGVAVRLAEQGELFNAPDGQFMMDDDLAIGMPLEVIVDVDSYDTANVRRVVARAADEAEVVEIKLKPSDPAKIGNFAGTIVDDAGHPKAGAQLRLVVLARDRIYPHQSYNWRMRERSMGGEGIVQYLSTVSGADGQLSLRSREARQRYRAGLVGRRCLRGTQEGNGKTSRGRAPGTAHSQIRSPARSPARSIARRFPTLIRF